MRKFCLSFLLILLSVICVAQTPTTTGKDFYVAFMKNSDYDPEGMSASNFKKLKLSIIVTGSRSCSGTITNSKLGYSRNFNVTAGRADTIQIPFRFCYNYLSDEITNKTLHVVTTDSISLYASNYANATFDVTNVLPTPTLYNEYMLSTYKGNGLAQFMIVAAEDNTVIDILPKGDICKGKSSSTVAHSAGTTYTITLNKGQVYQAWSKKELTGTMITARDCAKIAVFQGNVSVNIPSSGYDYSDHISELAMPTAYWGKQFVVTGSLKRSSDYYRVTALKDNCKVNVDGVLKKTLAAGQYYEEKLPSSAGARYVETSEPASVYLYFTSAEYEATETSIFNWLGDPSVTLINPIEQQLNEVTFGTLQMLNGTKVNPQYFVNIVTATADKGTVTLDGQNISSKFSTVSGNSSLSYARIEIQNGQHTLKNPKGGFVAHIYGIGNLESYSYSVGSKAVDLNKILYLEGKSSVEYGADGAKFCDKKTFHFKGVAEYAYDKMEWDMGDGTKKEGEEFDYTYAKKGIYKVVLTIYRQQYNCFDSLEDELEITLYVGEDGEQVEFDMSVNEDSYTWAGTTYTQSGDYTKTFTSVAGCDSIVTMHLKLKAQAIETEFFDEGCDTYIWNGTTYNKSGDYQQKFKSIDNNDSIVTLHLTIYNSVSTSFNAENCDSYTWAGTTYTESGNYEKTFSTVHGCDSTVRLNLVIHKKVKRQFVEETCQPFTWEGETYDKSGIYQRDYTTIHDCDSTLVLYLTVNKPYINEETVSANLQYEWQGTVYTESGDYQRTFETVAGCDSILILHLTINEAIHTEFYDEACDSYTWNGTSYNKSGDYQQKFKSIDNNDSIVTLHLTIYNSVSTSFNAENCDSYTWEGTTYTESGNYEKTFSTVHGCDSTVRLNLVIHKKVKRQFVEETCQPFTWEGETYDQSGIYQRHYTTIHDCDSTLVLYLTVNKPYKNEETVESCNEYEWQGTVYTESGNYQKTLQTIGGCDSILILHLTIKEKFETEFSDEACDSYTWNGQIYTKTGDYQQTLETVEGCDSIVTLHLTIKGKYDIQIADEACDSYTWNGEVYTQSGNYKQNLQSVDGCDSIVSLNLKIHNSSASEFSAESCGSYIWDGTEYTVAGDYTKYYSSIYGCDSIVTLHLTVGEEKSFAFDTVVCGKFVWNGVTYEESGIYEQRFQTFFGCDSIVTADVKIYPAVESFVIEGPSELVPSFDLGPGIYQYHIDPVENAVSYTWTCTNSDWKIIPKENDCELIVMTQGRGVLSCMVEGGCNSMTGSKTVVVAFSDLEEDALAGLQVYPNPASNKIYVEGELINRIEVVDIMGRVVSVSENDDVEKAEVSLDKCKSGTYFLRVQVADTVKIVKIFVK